MSNTQVKFSLGDIIAGISVALILIPQSMAYATLAGMPPIYGIYASILPPIIAAFFASSPYLQTGPVAMTSLLTFGVLASIAPPMSEQYIAYAALLALLIGIIRILIGISGSGFITYLMSPPLLAGFTAGATILIVISQIPAFLGVTINKNDIFVNALSAISQPQLWSLPAITLGIFSIAIIMIGKKFHALFPGVLIAVVLGIIYSSTTNFSGPVVGSLPSGLPSINFNFPWGNLVQLITPAIVIAIVGFAEPSAIARTFAAKNRQTWDENKEFISQGMANVAAGLSGTYPVGGSFSRTMINYNAGGKTRWSGAITGITVLLFTPVVFILAPLPKSILAAIVISAVLSLINFKALYEILAKSRLQGTVAWLTFFLTLFLAPRIDIALLIGVLISVAIHLWRERFIEVIHHYYDETLYIEPVGVLYFGSVQSLNESLLTALSKHSDAKGLTLDLRKIGRIDYSGVVIIQQIASIAENSGLTVKIISGEHPSSIRIIKSVIGDNSPWLQNDVMN